MAKARVNRPQIEPARFTGQLAGINTLLNAIREQIQIDQGDRGDPLDRAVKIRDLTEAGVTEFLLSKRGNGQYASVVAVSGNQLNVSSPPNPENLLANPTTATIYLTWGAPNYPYHAYTEVWRSNENNLSTAVDLGARPGYRYYADAVDTGRKYYYWIRFVTHAGKKSDFNAVDGVVAETFLPPEQVLISLSEKITSSQLSKELRHEMGSNANADLGNTISAFIDSDISSSLHDLKTIQQETNYFQSLYKQINQVTAKFNKSSALIKESQTVFADGFNALAEKTTTLEATISDNKTAIAEEKLRVDGLRASWSIKFQVGTDGVYRVSGFGINADGETTSAHFDVDEFSVSKPGADKLDFAIADVEQPDGSTKRMVVMDAAKLINLHVTNAMIENISADKITAGLLGAQFIDTENLTVKDAKSSNYLYQTSGWRLTKDGFFEINSSTDDGRIQQDGNGIKVFDQNGTLRVKMGKL
jgi:predicted phage tail protein